jgi:beta-phosphoglucomutase-like phosphatase (HAD superfamily)
MSTRLPAGYPRRALAAIIFDFDGVIADSERLHLRAYQEVLAVRGLRLTGEAYFEQYLGYDDAALLRRFALNQGLAWDDAAVAQLVAAKTQIYEDLTSRGEMLFPGAARFVRAAALVVPIAIASGALTHEIEAILDRASLRELFVTVVGADQTTRSKPSPDPYLEAFHRIRGEGHKVEADRTVAIEDSMWGLVSARGAGLRCVGVTNTCRADELAPHAELVVSGLDALTLDTLDTLVSRASTRLS